MLDRNHVKIFTLKVISILVDPSDKDRYEEAIARAKTIILDAVKDHVLPVIDIFGHCNPNEICP